VNDKANPSSDLSQPTETPSDFELQKFAFEREKLEFEKLKFAAEQTKRTKEIEKIDEEIQEYRRPLLRKASSLGAIATICVAIIAGILTFGTDIFKSNIRSLLADRSKLQKAVAKLTLEEQSLTKNTDELQQEKALLTEEKKSLTDSQANLISQRDVLIKNRDALKAQKSRLEHDVLMAPIQTRISLLGPDNTLGLPLPQESSDESIRVLTDFAIAHKSDPKVIDFFERSFNEARLNRTKAALAFVLFRSTGKTQWKEAVRNESISGATRVGSFFALNYYLHLLDSDLFSNEEKVAILRELYSKLTAEFPEEKQASNSSAKDSEKEALVKLKRQNGVFAICEIARWNKHATAQFREPWFSCHNGLLSELSEELKVHINETQAGDSLYRFSSQTYGIAVLQQTRLLGIASFTDGERITPDTFGPEKQCPAFTESFPLCIDRASHQAAGGGEIDVPFRIWHKSFAEYARWLDDNRELTSALLDPSHKVLSQVNVEVMGKLFDGTWITKSDLQGSQ